MSFVVVLRGALLYSDRYHLLLKTCYACEAAKGGIKSQTVGFETKTLTPSFIPQSDDGIHAHGASSGNVGSRQSHGNQ